MRVGAIVAFVGIGLVIVFAVQNTDPVPVRFSGWKAASAGHRDPDHRGAVILLTELIGVSYRRRRRRRAKREELRSCGTLDRGETSSHPVMGNGPLPPG